MNTTHESYVIFELAGSTYGIPSNSVQHLDMFEHVTRVPNANPAIDGVVFSRGHVIPALNLRARFGFPRAAHTLQTRIVFATVHGRVVGLIVDSAKEFKDLPTQSIRSIEETLTGINGKYLRAVTTVGGRLVLLLDLEAVLNLEDVQLPAETEAPPAQAATA